MIGYLKLIKNNVERKHLIFVELKDSDLIKALNQIENTIRILNSLNGKNIVHARIVLTKTYSPDILDNRVQKFIKNIESRKGTVDYASQQLREKKFYKNLQWNTTQ